MVRISTATDDFRDREKKIWFQFLMISSVASRRCPDQQSNSTMAYQNDPLTNWTTSVYFLLWSFSYIEGNLEKNMTNSHPLKHHETSRWQPGTFTDHTLQVSSSHPPPFSWECSASWILLKVPHPVLPAQGLCHTSLNMFKLPYPRCLQVSSEIPQGRTAHSWAILCPVVEKHQGQPWMV